MCIFEKESMTEWEHLVTNLVLMLMLMQLCERNIRKVQKKFQFSTALLRTAHCKSEHCSFERVTNDKDRVDSNAINRNTRTHIQSHMTTCVYELHALHIFLYGIFGDKSLFSMTKQNQNNNDLVQCLRNDYRVSMKCLLILFHKHVRGVWCDSIVVYSCDVLINSSLFT